MPGFKWINNFYVKLFGGVMRKSEMSGRFTGVFYYFAGVTLTAKLFSRLPSILGTMQLAIADPVASLCGRLTRHIYWSRIEGSMGGLGRNKGFLGFLGGALACVPVNFWMLKKAIWGGKSPSNGKLAALSVLTGAAGSFADLIVPTPNIKMPDKVWGVKMPPLHVDDNFVIPLVTAGVVELFTRWLNVDGETKFSDFLFF